MIVGCTGGFSVNVVLADLPPSATLVAVMVTIWLLPIEVGAAYCPLLEILPGSDGPMLQVTAALVPVTMALNCWLSPGNKFTPDGVTLTDTGSNVTTAVANWVGSAMLVAVTVTVCELETSGGAVYSPPLVMEPTLLLKLQLLACAAVKSWGIEA